MSVMHGTSMISNAARLPAVLEVVTLSGSSGTPNTATDFAISPANSYVYWMFNADGTIDLLKLQGADQFEKFSPDQWCNLTPEQDYWIRFTHNAGDASNLGHTSGTWFAMTSAIGQGWEETTDGFSTYEGSSKVEIATDSGGVTIVATGYYGGRADVEF